MAHLDPCDLYSVNDMLSDDERQVRVTVARFVDERVLPIVVPTTNSVAPVR